MNIQNQISNHIESQPEPKRGEMWELHHVILKTLPGCRLWFLDGTNDEGKVIANPTIGYGEYTIKYADGTSREFFQVGLLGVSTGISVHILGISDKGYLAATYGKRIGKGSISGYGIKFRRLADIDIDVLEEAIRYGVTASG